MLLKIFLSNDVARALKFAFILIIILMINPSLTIGKEIKFRLPDIINRYQPAIVPVINPEQTVLYLDRQNHPNNIGGISDHDDIWKSERINTEWGELINLTKINTQFSDVLFSISPDGNLALIYHNFGDTTAAGKFYLYEIEKNQFIKIAPLEIRDFYNKSTNFYGHLSYDKEKLLLSLERDDTYGGLDLYVSFYDKEINKWSKPLNLGSIINTNGIETSPFLGYDGHTLYFASSGHYGFGKLDLYMSRRLDDSWQNWSSPKNLGTIINTNQDDHCLYLTALADTAYIVSYDSINTRQGIYYVLMPDSLKPAPYIFLEGEIIRDKPKSEIVKIDVLNTNGEKVKSYNTKFTNYAIVLPVGNDYIIKFTADGYYESSFDLKLFDIDKHKRIKKNVVLNKKSLDSLYKKTIFFDFDDDKVKISNEFIDELKNYIKSINIKEVTVIGHTDKTGSDSYNLHLSRRRAENTKKYLQKVLGANINIKTEWKGSKEPLSEDDAKNRRVEIYFHY